MKKIIIFSCIFISIVLAAVLLVMQYHNKPERIIENYITAISNHDAAAAYQCTTSDFPKSKEGAFDYVDYIHSLDVQEVTDAESIDYAYFHRIEAIPEYQNYPKEDIRLFNVSYYLKTIDEKTTPIDSDSYKKSFLLIKEDNKWRIFSIEEK